jgi:hypothetical protein
MRIVGLKDTYRTDRLKRKSEDAVIAGTVLIIASLQVVSPYISYILPTALQLKSSVARWDNSN